MPNSQPSIQHPNFAMQTQVRQKLFISKWKNSGTWLVDKNLQRDYRPVSSWRTDMLTGEGAEEMAWILSAKISLLIVYLRPQSCITESFLALYHIPSERSPYRIPLPLGIWLPPQFPPLLPHSCSLTLKKCWRSIRGIIFWWCCNWNRRAWLLFFRCYDRISSISRTFESWDECKETK